jgi:hypothetical protein
MMIFLWFLKRNFKNNLKKNQTQPQFIDLHFENLVKKPQEYEPWERLMIQREN